MPVAAAVGGAVASIGGSILSSKATNKAANKAADTSLAVADKNNALALDIYGQNKGVLSPYSQRGNVAGDSINALLGLPGAQYQTTAPTVPQQQQPARPLSSFGGIDDYIRQINQRPISTPPYAGAPQQPQAPTVNPVTAKSAFDNYRNSTGYQFRVNEGAEALNSGFAGKGLLDSGAARKSLTNYGQNIASDEFGKYLGYLSNQQGVGLSGASALAGVGQNYVNNVSANNNSAGSAAANAALIKGQSNANMYGGIAGSLGNLFGSSYGGGIGG